MRSAFKLAAVLAGVLSALSFSNSAQAGLTGTSATVSVTHAGPFNTLSSLTNLSYTFGDTSPYVKPGWGTLTLTSPVTAGYDNALKLDFTAFGYAAFTGVGATTGTVQVNNLAEAFDLNSVHILVNGNSIGSGLATAGNGFKINWDTQSVFNANPTAPYVILAWNSSQAPAPGAMALLGMAGLVSHKRRRRD
ncbi:MAG TPA: hypothetical protein VG711_03940 [Phycisphaerales bacterium]|nr:hypothetical protein [Phycisphaerales bacterium]